MITFYSAWSLHSGLINLQTHTHTRYCFSTGTMALRMRFNVTSHVHCLPCFFVYNKPKVKFMHCSNHIVHYRKLMCYIIRIKRNYISTKYIFTWNTSLTGYRQCTIAFLQLKSLSRSAINSLVSTMLFSDWDERSSISDKIRYVSRRPRVFIDS
jgi:hypothetical protein